MGSWTTYYFWIPKTMLWSLNMVHYHFTLSLRAQQLQNWSSIPHNMAFGWYQGPLGFSCFTVRNNYVIKHMI